MIKVFLIIIASIVVMAHATMLLIEVDETDKLGEALLLFLAAMFEIMLTIAAIAGLIFFL